MITVTLSDGKILKYPKNTKILEIAKKEQIKYKNLIVSSTYNGELRDLQYELTEDGKLNFIELNTEEGMRVYVRSLLFLFIVAVSKKRPEVKIEVKNSIGDGLFCDITNGIILSKYDLKDIKNYMDELIEKKEKIYYYRVQKENILKKISKCSEGSYDKERLELLKGLPKDQYITLYRLLNECEYFFGSMCPDVGYLKHYDLLNYGSGVMLVYPNKQNVNEIKPFKNLPKLADIFDEVETWGKLIECGTVGRLNDYIRRGESRDVILIAEALHEKKIASIADYIYSKADTTKLVLIAGPSSSGKTTFAQRLSIELRVNGLKPYALSLDNYYKERVDTPKKENGEYDYETLDALELNLFNNDLDRILNGETVEIPTYNFAKGIKEYKGNTINIGDNGVLLIEGIHGLNEKLTASVNKERKIKIYISALTPMSFDNYNRIQTTDVRLLRRLVRDYKYRGKTASETIKAWKNVRHGEENYIYVFQEEADLMFNTTLIYELAVLKKYAEPILEEINPEMVGYTTARRLLDILKHVEPLEENAIPSNSIIKEFVGNSIFGDKL